MTMLPRRFALTLVSLAAPLLALTACNPESDAGVEPPPAAKIDPSPQAKTKAAELAKREDAQLAWLKTTLDKPEHAQVYSAAIGQARGRAEHCQDQHCINRALKRRESRLNFAEGKHARIPFLPFPSGQFARGEAGYSGPVRIVPLIDGKAMLVISLAFKGRRSCTLDGVMSRDDDKQTWTVASLEEGLPMLVFTPSGKDAFQLSYAEAGHQPHTDDYCTAGTSIDGRYTLAK
ncbi:hypothetical protein [Novosphingobium sp. fls2-241-R2A-195]|uniref:hypothetical protein n=1 Tax=Novosphingobium sp. fls2-241-R2A-195 TaxID=3040296 RepID=UPI00254D9730|nr:hypothetical protein [Novosphingobium sp. fls2-241-R2A-195]